MSFAAGPGEPLINGPAATLATYFPRLALDWSANNPTETHRRLHGCMLFVDISGFTALTERLASRGKVGAEEITEVIGGVFGDLLAIASSYGADLLKWGGDAVLLYFDGADSSRRAARAAHLMSESVRRGGVIRTSVGRTSLGVSIGGHYGAFDFYLLGHLHRELIVAGRAASITAEMEAIAESGEVVISAAMAEQLESGVIQGPKSNGFLVSGAPVADELAPGPSAVTGSAAVSLFPAVKADRLIAGGEGAEHRQATVAFIEFSGIDALVDAEGPGGVAAALGPVVEAAQSAADRYGVTFHETDISPNGGKIVLLGGVPVIRGNDAERLLRTVREVVSEHPPESPLSLRAGVNAGRVFVFVHDFELAGRRVFAVTGDAMNLAARVMSRAGPGTVVATDAALVKARNPFEREPLAPFKVKGKSQPVTASVVGRPRNFVAEENGDGLPFVDRDGELTETLNLADAVTAGVGAVLLVVGAPGIGKSRLVSEAMDRWALGTVRVACEEYGVTKPYLPFRRIITRLMGLRDETSGTVAAEELRSLVQELVPHLEGYLPLLADILDIPVGPTREVDQLDPRFRRSRLEDLVVQLLRAYLPGPSALVFEDADRIDEASSSLLRRIGSELDDLPLLIVLTGSPDTGWTVFGEDGAGRVIELGPISTQGASQLAAGHDLSPRQVALIVERADGNPLFLRELVRAVVDRSGLDESDGLPESIEPLMVAQIDRLAPADRQALRTAAVVGSHFDPVLVSEILPGEAAVDESVLARLNSFVEPTGSGWRFAHNLMRDAAYEGLSYKIRRVLHGRAARAIESRAGNPEEVAEVLSLHWLNAEDYGRAWVYATAAGERARALAAHADAATFYSRALEAASHLSLSGAEVLAVAEALGDSCELAAFYDRARNAYDQARLYGSEPVVRARLLRKTGVLYERQGRYPQALACYTRGRKLVTGSKGDPGIERCELDLASAGILSRQGRFRDCIRFAASAEAASKASGYRVGLAHALYLRYIASVYLNQPEIVLAEKSLAIFEDLDDLVGQANVLNNLGIQAYYSGRWGVSLDDYERSMSARQRAGDVVGAATAENNIAEILSDQGLYDRARPLLVSARATWRVAGYRVGVALATSNIGRLEARAGYVATGLTLIEEALAEFRAMHASVFVVETEMRRAECQVLAGEFQAARAALEDLLSGVRGKSSLEQVEVGAMRLMGTVEALSGESTGRLDEAVKMALGLDAAYELALTLATKALLGGPDSEESDYRAKQMFAALGVQQAPICWAPLGGGEPLIARG